jgi:hypothetical protein
MDKLTLPTISILHKLYRPILPVILPILFIVSVIKDSLSKGNFEAVSLWLPIGLGVSFAFLLWGNAEFNSARWNEIWLRNILTSPLPQIHLLLFVPAIVFYISIMYAFVFTTMRIFFLNLDAWLFAVSIFVTAIVVLPVVAGYIRLIRNFRKTTLQ